MADIVLNSIEELDEFLSKLSRLDYSRALGQAGAFLERTAKENITSNGSVDTGLLRNSITFEVEGDTVTVGTNVEYAPYIEYGTGLFAEKGDGRTDVPWVYCDEEGNFHSTLGQEPKPFLRPALNDNRDEVTSLIKREIMKEVRRYGR